MYKLYRHFDEHHNLLYVGVSLSPIVRLYSHRKAEWWKLISKIEIQNFNSKNEAMNAEIFAIQNENPLFNTNGKRKSNFKKRFLQNEESSSITKKQIFEYFKVDSCSKVAQILGYLNAGSVCNWADCLNKNQHKILINRMNKMKIKIPKEWVQMHHPAHAGGADTGAKMVKG